jgi:hypothetical protein
MMHAYKSPSWGMKMTSDSALPYSRCRTKLCNVLFRLIHCLASSKPFDGGETRNAEPLAKFLVSISVHLHMAVSNQTTFHIPIATTTPVDCPSTCCACGDAWCTVSMESGKHPGLPRNVDES